MYLNGSAHRSLERTLFTGRESWEVLDFLARYFVRDRPAAVARWALAMFDYDETATLGTIRIPTLVVAGDRDERVTPGAQAFMCARIPGARLLMLRPAKHGGLLEYPQRFCAAPWRVTRRRTAHCRIGTQKSPSKAAWSATARVFRIQQLKIT